MAKLFKFTVLTSFECLLILHGVYSHHCAIDLQDLPCPQKTTPTPPPLAPVPSLLVTVSMNLTFPGSSAGKESTSNAGDPGLIPGLGRSPGEGNGYPLQYSGLENSMDYIVHGVAKSRTQLSDFYFSSFSYTCSGSEDFC